MTDTTGVYLRWMLRADIPAVLAIEAKSFADYWTEEDFLRCLRQNNCIGTVAEADGIFGYMLYQLHPNHLRLLNFAVHPGFRCRGVGTKMVNKLVHKVASHRREKVTLVVKEDNLAAQRFFSGRGFYATEILRDYYADGDAYLMELYAPVAACAEGRVA